MLAPIVAFLVFLAIWQVAYLMELKPPYALPSPADVAGSIAEVVADGRAWEAVRTSVSRGVIGFLVGAVIGTLLGLLLTRFKTARLALQPYLSGLQSLPSVAWVPAAIIWFGLTPWAIFAVVLLGSVPSITNGLLAGFDQIPPLYHKVGRVLGLNALGRVRHVSLPAALPGYLSGLKQGWAFSWRSLMAAELITTGAALGLGLGGLLNLGRDLSQMDLVFTAILLILLVGVGIELAVFAPIERRVLRTRGLGRQ